MVGSKTIRGSDPNWPEPGSRFHHTVGPGPVHIRDNSEVEAADPPRMLKLLVKARPAGTGRVTLNLVPLGDGRTHVTMVEDPADPITAIVFNPLTHLLMRGRNVESLRRLEELATGQVSLDAGQDPEEA